MLAHKQKRQQALYHHFTLNHSRVGLLLQCGSQPVIGTHKGERVKVLATELSMG